MAKEAKEVEVQHREVTERAVKSMTKRIMERLENIESAKGRYMNAARKERDAMSEIYEGAAHEGIPQKLAKLHVKVLTKIEELKGLMSELEAEDQAFARKMAKLQADDGQLALWKTMPVLKVPPKIKEAVAEKPKAEKPAKAADKPKATKAAGGSKKKGSGATGADIAKADEAAGSDDAETEAVAVQEQELASREPMFH